MIAALLEALDRFLEAAATAKRHRRRHKSLAAIEKKFEAAMQKAFRAQGKAFLKRFVQLADQFPVKESIWIGEALREPDWESLYDEVSAETLQLFIDPISIAVAAALRAGALAHVADLGLDVSFTLQNPRAVAFLQDHALEAARHINATTKSELAKIVKQGVEEGWSYDRIAREIVAKYAQYAEGRPQEHISSRAHGIAVYESGEAYSEGNRIVAQDLQDGGLEMEKRWLTVRDERVEPECRANEAQGWIPLNQAHSSGHQRPLAHYACRCDEQYRRKAD